MKNLPLLLYVDKNCGIIESRHVSAEKRDKRLDKLGSTRCGTTMGNADRALRRIHLAKDEKRLEPYLTDVSLTLDEALRKGESILIEGTQGVGLSLFHGNYPYVTSKDVTTASLLADVGIGFKGIRNVFLVCRPFPVRIAEGPLFGELTPAEVNEKKLWEYSTHMKRPKRIGRFDFEFLKKAVRLTGANNIALTHADSIDRLVYGCRNAATLTTPVREFISEAEGAVGIPVTLISSSPYLSDVIDLRE